MGVWPIIAAVIFGFILIVIAIVLMYALKQAIYIENTMNKMIEEEEKESNNDRK